MLNRPIGRIFVKEKTIRTWKLLLILKMLAAPLFALATLACIAAFAPIFYRAAPAEYGWHYVVLLSASAALFGFVLYHFYENAVWWELFRLLPKKDRENDVDPLHVSLPDTLWEKGWQHHELAVRPKLVRLAVAHPKPGEALKFPWEMDWHEVDPKSAANWLQNGL